MDPEAIFRSLDTNADGVLSYEELAAQLLGHGTDPDQLSELFNSLDINADGQISLAEFSQGFSLYSGHTPHRPGNMNTASTREDESPGVDAEQSPWTESSALQHPDPEIRSAAEVHRCVLVPSAAAQGFTLKGLIEPSMRQRSGNTLRTLTSLVEVWLLASATRADTLAGGLYHPGERTVHFDFNTQKDTECWSCCKSPVDTRGGGKCEGCAQQSIPAPPEEPGRPRPLLVLPPSLRNLPEHEYPHELVQLYADWLGIDADAEDGRFRSIAYVLAQWVRVH